MAEIQSTEPRAVPELLRTRIDGRLAARQVSSASDVIQPRRSQGPVPLSYPQSQLWLVDRLAPGGSTYNVASAFELLGALDAAVLARSLEELVRRHEALRTTFTVLPDGEPVQVIAPRPLVALPLIDLGLLGTEAAAAAFRLTAAEAARPFDLERGPLLRTTLLRLEPEHHLLLLTLHHIIADDWSLEVLHRELAALYGALAGRGPKKTPTTPAAAAGLEPLPLQYADWTLWQRGALTGERLERLLAFWRETLAGAPESLELPADRSRPPVQSFRGGVSSLPLAPELAQPVEALARRQRATSFIVLLAAWQVLLGRLTGQRDVVSGTPFAGRTRSESTGLIGCFVNLLPLRSDLAAGTDRVDGPSFTELVERTRRVVLAALHHQEMPFERLVAELAPKRDLSRTPLVQAIFQLERERDGRLELPRLAVRRLPVDHASAKFDFSLTVVDGDGRYELTACYARDLFDAATAVRWLRHLRTLLAAALADPERSIAELPLLEAGELRAVLCDWSDGGALPAPANGEALLHRLVEAQVARTPGAVAVVWAPEGENRVELTYAELDQCAGRLARRLQALGVGPEVRVGVALERTPDMPVALLAILKAGGAYVPLDPSYPAPRLTMMIDDACKGQQGFVLLTQERLLPRLSEVLNEAREKAPLHVLCVDASEPSLSFYSEFLSPPPTDPSNLAYLIYTSGSTGRPKGVAIEHRSAATFVQWARKWFSDEELAGVFASTSINFDLSVFELFVPLAWGGRVILGENALALAGSPAAAEVTLINTVPSAIAELLRLGAVPASVRTVNLAGEPLRGALVERLYALGTVERVLNLYGPSEDTTYSTFTLVPRSGTVEPTIGRAVAGSRAYVLDRASQPCAPGVRGELHLGGAGLARGYLHRPGLTAERFVPDPFAALPGARLYRTGDLARWRTDGELEFLGRIDHQVKVRGFRIELGEIETALAEHPAVREAVVVARGDSAEQRLVAYVVARDGVVEVAALRAWLAGRLPAYMVPAAWSVLEALPLTPSGKVDRRALPEPARIEAATGYVAPRGPVEDLVAEIWSELLRVERVGAHDSFFALGGHSLLATRVLWQLRDTLGLDLPIAALFDAPTLEGFALVVEESLLADDGEIVATGA